MARTTELYLLADGTHAKPSDCEPDADGVLRHIYGMAVALDENSEPETVSRGARDNGNLLAAGMGAAPQTREVQAEPAATFKNRQVKSK